MSNGDQIKAIREAATRVADLINRDVAILNGPMYEDLAESLDEVLSALSNRRGGVFLILVTNGGDAHAAYMIARVVQRRYADQVTICIPGDCYSAGSIVVMGAHELVITDTGRMGPLDVQILKKDELGERLSGLTLKIAMGELRTQTFDTFQEFLLKLKRRFGSQLSLRMAMDVAAKMSTDLHSEIYKQMDPLKIGEDVRAMHIAEHYGELLSRKSGNVKAGTIERLLETYPSHSCVIDRDEAKELFGQVREPTDEERALLALIGGPARYAEDSPDDALALVLSEEIKEVTGKNNVETSAQRAGAGAAQDEGDHRIGDPAGNPPAGIAAGGNGKASEAG